VQKEAPAPVQKLEPLPSQQVAPSQPKSTSLNNSKEESKTEKHLDKASKMLEEQSREEKIGWKAEFTSPH
jgi:hypothetical protein